MKTLEELLKDVRPATEAELKEQGENLGKNYKPGPRQAVPFLPRRRIVALLESMWNWQGCHTGQLEADRYFRINPDNFSGRRLYRICGEHSILVTNSCRYVQKSANHHGTPDSAWVAENLKMLEPFELLLVCGKIARKTYESTGLHHPKVIFMDHPAARRWSNATLDAMTKRVAELLA